MGDKNVIKCRTCSSDHWISECPWKDTMLAGGNIDKGTTATATEPGKPAEYKYNEDDKKVKIVVSKSSALRKTWNKFGEPSTDKPGPNPATTIVGEDVFKQYVTSKKKDNKVDNESGIGKLKALGDKNVIKCRTCRGDHWTSKCPKKDTVLAGSKVADMDKKGTTATATEPGKAVVTTKYVPRKMCEGAGKHLDSTTMASKKDDTNSIRMSNLSESTTKIDLAELVKPFGPLKKLFLAMDKQTGQCKGFAYIHFKFRNDAVKAIATLNGHEYDHWILNVDWSKPPARSNR